MHRREQCTALAALAAVAVVALLGDPVHAATIVVNTTSDGTVGPGGICEFRDAIRAANDDDPSGGCNAGSGADLIDLTQLAGLPDSIDLDAGEGVLVIDGDVTIQGPGADQLTVSGQNAVQVMRIAAGRVVEIHGLTLADGIAEALGRGGALEIEATAEVTLTGCRVTASAAFNGGGISNAGSLRIDRCTVDGNQTTGDSGGGIVNSGQLVLNNATISGNAATSNGGAGAGGGIANFASEGAPTTAALFNVTLSDNGATSGGGVFNDTGATMTLTHTLLANAVTGGNCVGVITSEGYNLSDDAACSLSAAGDLDDTAADIGLLEDNGGPTPTHALETASPAVDGGDTACADSDDVAFDTDQRGEPRPTDGDQLGGFECDIGAYELLPEPATASLAAIVALALALAGARRRQAKNPSRHPRGRSAEAAKRK